MRVEVYKSGTWHELNWPVGMGPEVDLEAEFPAPFTFQSPEARVSFFDDDAIFGRSGSLEIVRGDRVRVYASAGSGDPAAGALVFDGVASQGVEWDEAEGVGKFRAVGWMAGELKEIYAGKANRQAGDPDSPNPFDPTAETRRYRYVRRVDLSVDADGNAVAEGFAGAATKSYEYIAEPWLIEDSWEDQPSKRVGYSKVYLFDTRGVPFALESTQSRAIYEQVEAGLYRRILDVDAVGGGLTPTSLRSIAENLLAQILETTDGYGNPSSYGLDFDPGEITGDIDVAIKEQSYRDIDLFQAYSEGADRLFCVGFGWAPGSGGLEIRPTSGTGNYGGASEVFEISNQVGADLKHTLDFSQGRSLAQETHGNGGLEWGRFPEQLPKSFGGSYLTGRGSVVVYVIWSLVAGGDANSLESAAVCQWYDLPLAGGNSISSGVFTETVSTPYSEPNDPHIDTLDYGYPPFEASQRLYLKVSSGRDGRTNPPTYPPVRQNRREMTVNGVYYRMFDTMLFAAGNLALSYLAFDLRDKRVTEVFVELAKVTNSVFWVDNAKVIHLRGRDDLGTTRVVSGSVTSWPVIRRDDWFGARIPEIGVGIVQSEGYSKALDEYYGSTYYPQAEERIAVECEHSDEAVAIALMDGVYFDLIPTLAQGNPLGPLQARRIVIREGSVLIEGGRRI